MFGGVGFECSIVPYERSSTSRYNVVVSVFVGSRSACRAHRRMMSRPTTCLTVSTSLTFVTIRCEQLIYVWIREFATIPAYNLIALWKSVLLYYYLAHYELSLSFAFHYTDYWIFILNDSCFARSYNRIFVNSIWYFTVLNETCNKKVCNIKSILLLLGTLPTNIHLKLKYTITLIMTIMVG